MLIHEGLWLKLKVKCFHVSHIVLFSDPCVRETTESSRVPFRVEACYQCFERLPPWRGVEEAEIKPHKESGQSRVKDAGKGSERRGLWSAL